MSRTGWARRQDDRTAMLLVEVRDAVSGFTVSVRAPMRREDLERACREVLDVKERVLADLERLTASPNRLLAILGPLDRVIWKGCYTTVLLGEPGES